MISRLLPNHGRRTQSSTPAFKSEHSASRAALKKTRGRIYAMIFFMVAAYVAVAVRLTELTLHRELMDSHRVVALTGKKSILSGRADILDRNGKILASTLDTASLYADPQHILDPVEAAQKLSATFPELKYDTLLKQFQSDKRFVWLKRHLTPAQEYQANRLGLPGIEFTKEQRRVYPNGKIGAHVIGYTDIDNKGVMGIEKSFDELLSEGKREITTTLDTRIQYILEKELDKSVKEFSAIGAAGMVMDIHTGEIIAMASLPDFDPNNPSDTPIANQYNRVTMGSYEMGSTFKIFSTAALFEFADGRVYHTFDARKPIEIAGFKIRDFHAEKRVLSVPEIFIHSSNIGTAHMADKVGTPAMMKFYTDLGLFQPASLELNEIGKPLIPFPWRHINTLTASYGHGIAISPLQLITAVSGVTNGGMLPSPTLIKRPNREDYLNARRRIISSRTSEYLDAMMRLVVSDGTGKQADAPGYRVGGKTGSAEKLSKHGGYQKHALLSSFVGVYPIDNPKYAVFVMVDEPKGTKRTYGYATGGWVAAPAVGRIVEQISPLLGVAQKDDTITTQARKLMRLNQKGRRLASY